MDATDDESYETTPLKQNIKEDNEFQEQNIDDKNESIKQKETPNQNVNECKENSLDDQIVIVETEPIDNDMAVVQNEDSNQPAIDGQYTKIASSEAEPIESNANHIESANMNNGADKIDNEMQQHVQEEKAPEPATEKLESETVEITNNETAAIRDDMNGVHKEIVLSEKTDENKDVEIDVITPENTEEKQNEEEDKVSCGERFIKNWAKLIYIIMVIATLSLVGVLIGINKPDEEAGVIVGLVCFNMILSGILMPWIGTVFIKGWTKNTWWLIFFIVYIATVVDVIAFGTYLKEVQVLLILYGVIKILCIYYAFMFAKIDGKHFISSIISGYITMKFIKHETVIYKLIPLYLICLFIQICMFSIGCMAFVIDGNDVFGALFIVALVLFVWLINTPRHFLTYMTARVVAMGLRKSEKESLDENDDILKLAFKATFNKFMTITIGSFLVTTTPIWYFITNLMTAVKIVTAGLVICCLPCTGDDNRCNVAGLVTCVSAIAYGIAWITRKISKWTLRITAKLLLISSGFLNCTFWEAIKIQNNTIRKETKSTFGSDMLFLDNAILSTNTHLCILISSIGAWLTYLIKPEATVICWVSGYCACRTMFEIVDVILLTFLIAWFVEPRIIYNDQLLFADFKIRIREMIEKLFPNETEEYYAEAVKELIEIQMREITGLQKTTDPTHITNLQETTTEINVAQETRKIVHETTGQIVAGQQTQAIIINQQTAAIDDDTSDMVNNTNVTTNDAITYQDNTDKTEIR